MQYTPKIQTVQFPQIEVSRKLILVAAVVLSLLAIVIAVTSALGANASLAPTIGNATVSQTNQVVSQYPGPLFSTSDEGEVR